MFSIFTHVMKPVRDTHSEPGLPMIIHEAKSDSVKGTFPAGSYNIICDTRIFAHLSTRIQRFQVRLSYERGKAFATMSKVIMGSGGFANA